MDKAISPGVLIVDDKNLLRHGLARELEEEGYKVYGAANRQDALQLCKTQMIDVALLDVQLPDMDGYGLCTELCKKSDIPVIIVTGSNQASDMLEGYAAGASAFVSKPFQFRELSAQIRETLSGEQ
jgi:DNA-binding response OmpR family regulator